MDFHRQSLNQCRNGITRILSLRESQIYGQVTYSIQFVVKLTVVVDTPLILWDKHNDTLKVKGMEYVKSYRGIRDKSLPKKKQEECGNKRHFCGECGCMLWAYDQQYPEWCYPFASAIDTPLPKPKQIICIMLKDKADWAHVPEEAVQFDEYPNESIESWHKNNEAWVD
ncbi:5067_t:CDS:2 [Funneliformis geosporum]|uniref:3583_t:CDS:1 n=1 Tax=Funneliformis geosporum TaxID=1117311 RepID=A0A9W4SBW5_9GLOM|nr:5067_t:CDS:2 [Funneliformis geosporum]CAI2162729.1 3583_t:CDS:2 [Funneliformis geosporum]